MTKYPLIEPKRGIMLLETLVELPHQYPRIAQFAPIGADIFTFIYPVLLVVLYLKGIIKKHTESKEAALFIFLSCLASVVFNIFIQLFFVKARPMVELFHLEAKETILHRFLPSSAFPSDHATVSMAIAVATLIWGYKTKNRCLMYTGYALIVVAIVMCTCRVITTLHRPTDIIGGFGVGILIPTLLSLPFLFPHVKRYLISPLIQFQEWIFSWFEKK